MAQIVYELSFKGAASEALRAMFDDHEVSVGDGETTLRGQFADQSALVDAIERIYGLGLELFALRTMAESTADDLRAWDPAGGDLGERGRPETGLPPATGGRQ